MLRAGGWQRGCLVASAKQYTPVRWRTVNTLAVLSLLKRHSRDAVRRTKCLLARLSLGAVRGVIKWLLSNLLKHCG